MTGPLQVSSSLPSSVPFLWHILLASDEQVAEHSLPSAPLPRGGAHAAPFRIAKAGFPPSRQGLVRDSPKIVTVLRYFLI